MHLAQVTPDLYCQRLRTRTTALHISQPATRQVQGLAMQARPCLALQMDVMLASQRTSCFAGTAWCADCGSVLTSPGAHEQRPGPSSKTDESGREEDHEDAEGQHVSVAPQAADQQQRDADAQEGPAAREHGMETRDAEPLAESEPPLEAVEGKPDTEVMVSDGAGVAVEAEIQEVAQQTHEELSGHADDSKKGREPEDGPPAASQDAKRTVTADDTDAPSSVQPAQSDDDAGDNHAPAGRH